MQANLGLRSETAAGTQRLVSGQLISACSGIELALGRSAGSRDDRVDGEAERRVLSHDYWVTAFRVNPIAVRRDAHRERQAPEIVGVAPRGLHHQHDRRIRARAWYTPRSPFGWSTTNARDPESTTSLFSYWIYVFGRLKTRDPRSSRRSAAIQPAYQADLE